MDRIFSCLDDDELYCKVFLYADMSVSDVVDRVARILEGRVSRRVVEGEHLEVDILRNDDYDAVRAADGAGDFLFFPYLLEVEARPSETMYSFKEAVKALLTGLDKEAFQFATAADFEQELPNNGRSKTPDL